MCSTCQKHAFIAHVRIGVCHKCKNKKKFRHLVECQHGYPLQDCVHHDQTDRYLTTDGQQIFQHLVPRIMCTQCEQYRNVRVVNYFSIVSSNFYTHETLSERWQPRKMQDLSSFLNIFHKLRLAYLAGNTTSLTLTQSRDFLGRNQTLLEKELELELELENITPADIF